MKAATSVSTFQVARELGLVLRVGVPTTGGNKTKELQATVRGRVTTFNLPNLRGWWTDSLEC